MATKILLLEDDLSLSEIIEEFLSDEGYEVCVCVDAQEALNLAYEKYFDLWILDVKVPMGDGFSLLKDLRHCGKETPAIFMTSLNTVNDLKEGFSSGCDDYIKKPFELAELSIRIKALLKRSFSHKNEDFEDLGNGFKFNFASQILYSFEKPLSLPSKEVKLLSLLLKNKNIFLSTEKIFEELWDYNEEPSELSLRAYIKNLRKLLGKEKIINQRGRGYRYE
ncbi:response regulator transcription factor [Campylobacter sp. LH-2024]|uniref:Response regulator transcription factor n=1 Tax=Campylobacter molothri TaxID=1032242 RepID=A0ACC5W059_9BACT|nr:response regulator transcription factor [Campylobacter sp. RM10542]MBZ7929487.1 response regulator transcription factor [Campylobacter sp. W0067]MBZ7931835.1 response regulator transcription factor [Campylobacter sp. RM12910]MBZ7932789.1 response regulator transcription factor [Campylobacter sp. RM10543]MBZ7937287.1 response regulator transcription factor [Campylobacter sp. RM10538]MBZ7940738.1 response regulator transcription factor [Campylobacter sp. W0047]MBZ7943432.1 response regulator